MGGFSVSEKDEADSILSTPVWLALCLVSRVFAYDIVHI